MRGQAVKERESFPVAGQGWGVRFSGKNAKDSKRVLEKIRFYLSSESP